MKTSCICTLISLACLLILSEAGIVHQLSEVHPEHRNNCVWINPSTKHPTYRQVGSSWKSGDCSRTSCKKISGNLSLLTESCDVLEVDPACHLTPVDPTKFYPNCCPKPSCPPKN